MAWVFIDSASQYSYIGFVAEQKVIYEKYRLGNNDHSEKQVDFLSECLQDANLTVNDLEAVVVGFGPGSYTGLRAALTVGKVLALVKKLPIYRMSSLDLLLSGKMMTDGAYLATIMAKKNASYVKAMVIKDGKISSLSDETYLENTEIAEQYPNYQVLTTNVGCYNIEQLLAHDFVVLEPELHQLVPNYLRSGVWDVH